MSNTISENAISKAVILTDGMTESDAVGKKIVQLNLNSKMPVIALGIGFDANINFLSFLGDVTVIGKFPIFRSISDQNKNAN